MDCGLWSLNPRRPRPLDRLPWLVRGSNHLFETEFGLRRLATPEQPAAYVTNLTTTSESKNCLSVREENTRVRKGQPLTNDEVDPSTHCTDIPRTDIESPETGSGLFHDHITLHGQAKQSQQARGGQ